MNPRYALILLAGGTSVLFSGVDVACAQIRVSVPYSVRSYGMGLTGTADDYDPYNVFYNPAIIGSIHGLALCGNLSPDLIFSGDDNRGWNAMVAGGYLRQSGESSGFGFGAALNYTGWKMNDLWFVGESNERTIGISAALRFLGSGRTSVGLGLGVKRWEFDPQPRVSTWYAIPSGDGQLLDAGIIISNETASKSGRLYGVSVGVSLINWGDDDNLEYLLGHDLSEARFGFGLRVARPDASATVTPESMQPSTWRLSVNVDFVARKDDRDSSAHTGAEFSIREIGFLRAGYEALLADEVVHHATVGLGVGYDWGRVKFRIDYARVPASKKSDSGYPLDYFGLHVGYAFDPAL
jgi:hypothetical protein